jgi:hypothetical protein
MQFMVLAKVHVSKLGRKLAPVGSGGMKEDKRRGPFPPGNLRVDLDFSFSAIEPDPAAGDTPCVAATRRRLRLGSRKRDLEDTFERRPCPGDNQVASLQLHIRIGDLKRRKALMARRRRHLEHSPDNPLPKHEFQIGGSGRVASRDDAVHQMQEGTPPPAPQRKGAGQTR